MLLRETEYYMYVLEKQSIYICMYVCTRMHVHIMYVRDGEGEKKRESQGVGLVHNVELYK